MDAALVVSATLLGLAGSPHCAAMCSAPCAAVTGGARSATISFHLARVAGYATAGAVAAASVSSLALWTQWSPALRPLWALLHAGALALGLWLLFKGCQPAWLERLGRAPLTAGGSWQRIHGPSRAAAIGSVWFAWPCGFLQSALLVAAMANGAAGGGLAMAGFALASAPALAFGPWAWSRWVRQGDAVARERFAVRAAGGLLVLASGWALGAGVWHDVAAFCATL